MNYQLRDIDSPDFHLIEKLLLVGIAETSVLESYINSYFVVGYVMIGLYFSFKNQTLPKLKTFLIPLCIYLLLVIYNLLFWGKNSETELIYYCIIIAIPIITWNKSRLLFYVISMLSCLILANSINYINIIPLYFDHKMIDVHLINQSLFTDRPYNSMYILIFISLGLSCIRAYDLPKAYKYFIYFSSVFLSFFFILYSVRFVFILIPFLGLIYLITEFKNIHFSLKSISVIVLIVSILLYLGSKNDFLIQGVKLMKNIDDPRVSIWTCASEQLGSNWKIGTKELSTKDDLQYCFKRYYDSKHSWEWIYRDHFIFDCHNQYIEFLLRFGISGWMLFLLIHGFLLIKSFRLHQKLLAFPTIILTSFFFIESILSRQKGLVIYIFIFSILLNYIDDNKKQSQLA